MTNTYAPEFIEKFRMGDRRAFRAVIRRFSTTIKDYVNGIIYNDDEARLIAKSCFSKLYMRSYIYRNIEQVESFLHVCARNEALDYLRGLKRFTDEGMELMNMFNVTKMPEGQPRQIAIENVYKHMCALPHYSRKILTHTYIYRNSNKRIGEIMSIEPADVAAMTSIALRELGLKVWY